MLIHQSMVDGAACFFATILFLQPFNWVPGVKILDDIVCHVWSSQLVYWYMILVSGKYLNSFDENVSKLNNQQEHFDSFLETIRVIIPLNSR